MEQGERRFAILVDTDNVPPKYIKHILNEISNQGIAIYKRIHGDWINSKKRSWRNVLLNWSVSPIQQYSYATGKNTMDSAMIIDAMDVLYSGNVDSFYPVSSDSDSTKLAQKLKEAGMFVMEIGGQRAPKPFQTACDTFKLLEITSSDDALKATVTENRKTVTGIDEIQKAIAKLLIENNSQNQPITLAQVGNFLIKRFSDFDVGNYGYSKFSTSLESLDNNDFQAVKLRGGSFVQEKSASTSKTEVEKVTVHMTRENNGHVDNLSTVHDELKKILPSPDAKQYGFSRISSLTRDFGSLKIRDNMIQMK